MKNILSDVEEVLEKYHKIGLMVSGVLDSTLLAYLLLHFKHKNKKDNKKENIEISPKDEINESPNTVETCDSADVDNIVDTEVNYIHDLDVFEKNVYEEKNNINYKKLFDRL